MFCVKERASRVMDKALITLALAASLTPAAALSQLQSMRPKIAGSMSGDDSQHYHLRPFWLPPSGRNYQG